jgi:hypothetical protein
MNKRGVSLSYILWGIILLGFVIFIMIWAFGVLK